MQAAVYLSFSLHSPMQRKYAVKAVHGVWRIGKGKEMNYYIKIKGTEVPVTEEIYKVYCHVIFGKVITKIKHFFMML